MGKRNILLSLVLKEKQIRVQESNHGGKTLRSDVIIEKGEGSSEKQVVPCLYSGKTNHTASFYLEKKRNNMIKNNQMLSWSPFMRMYQ